MITFKCKMCGGDLAFEPGASVAECPYCGTNQTLPKLDDDKRANLYDRANHFRRQNEFDKAMAIYEQILAEDRTDAEAYWSLVLCRYGIEYVEDPASHKRVPTVNRVQYASILADEDYKSALQYADTQQRSVYEAEANAIAEIQKGILDISRKEAPFDVFICYKETDANGRRTPDSVLANDMYHQLTKEGFKVFFSRITLEDKIGTAYEPYIFAALNSAKVMVVLGTKPEYFGAVWVKNEWSRYLALIRGGADKTLVPAYRDMDPYDLPEEFAHLQAQDMGKLGFMQDLIRGIKKILHKDEPKPQTAAQPTAAAPANNVAPLLKRAFMFLEDGDFARADDFCEQVLNLDPENGRAYLGKLMVDLQVRRESDLKNQTQPFDDNGNYQKIMRFGDDILKKQVQGDVMFIKNRNEHDRQRSIFDGTVEMLRSATTVDQCQAAKNRLNTIPDFEGVQAQLTACDEKIESIKAVNYGIAVRLMQNKEYKKAIVAFTYLQDYSDSKSKIAECEESIRADAYQNATVFKNNGKWNEAICAFEKLGDYRDSREKIEECEESIRADAYQKAEQLRDAGKWEEAVQAFDALSAYRDSKEQVCQCREAEEVERKAEEQRREHDRITAERKAKEEAARNKKIAFIAAAVAIVAIAVGLFYTNVIKPNSIYNSAVSAMKAGNYDEATAIFEGLGEYKDAVTQARESQYQKGLSLIEESKSYLAFNALRKAGTDYKDVNSYLATLETIVAKNTVKIAAGGAHTVGLKSDGRVIAVGRDGDGQCNTYDWKNITAVTAGGAHTMGLKSDGTVVTVGDDTDGMYETSEWKDIVAVATGSSHMVGLKSDGTVVAVGYNTNGRCDTSEWKEIVAVAVGSSHIVGLKSNGTVVAVGDNTYGQCNTSDWKDIVTIAAGINHTVGLKSDGTVVAVGHNTDGVCDTSEWKDIVAIAAGIDHTVGLKSDGTVVVMGYNTYGQCDTSDWKDVVAVAAGSFHTVGLKSDGMVVTVGRNSEGQCDTGNWKLEK